MGVPSLFRYVVRKFPDTLIKEVPAIDYMYIDFNAIIHRCCKPSFLPIPKNEKEIFMNIKKYLENIYKIIQPNKLVYISTDGVAPRSKINQQRARRYQSNSENKIIKEKEIIFINNEENKIEADEIREEFIFESNSITPGTEFMKRLDEFMISLIKYFVSKEWSHLIVIYSSSAVPGEGEQKITEFIRKQNVTDFNHLIYSPDADLIFLYLILHEKKVFLMRNDHSFETKQQKNFCTNCNFYCHSEFYCGKIELVKYLYLDSSVIKKHIFEFFRRHLKRNYDEKRMIEDFVFVCSFAGNDFVPILSCLDVSFGAIDNLLFILTYTFNFAGIYITEEGKVNFMGLKCFLKNFAKYEDVYYFKKLENLRKNRKAAAENQTVQEEILLEEKNDETLKEAEKTFYSEVPEHEEILLNTEGGKKLYYSKKLKLKSAEEVEEVCISYLKQLCWTFRYYMVGNFSWDHYYPFLYSPFVSDLANVKELDIKFELGAPLSPLEQLICVNPPLTKELVPTEFHVIYDEFKEYYPDSVEVDMFDKLLSYQAVVLLPFIDIKKVLPRISQLMENVSVETAWLNICDKPKLFMNKDNFMGKRILQMYKSLKTNFIFEYFNVKGVIKPYFSINFDEEGFLFNEEYENKCVYGVYEFLSSKYLRREK